MIDQATDDGRHLPRGGRGESDIADTPAVAPAAHGCHTVLDGADQHMGRTRQLRWRDTEHSRNGRQQRFRIVRGNIRRDDAGLDLQFVQPFPCGLPNPLELAVRLGYSSVEWLREFEEFAPLVEHPNFENLVTLAKQGEAPEVTVFAGTEVEPE